MDEGQLYFNGMPLKPPSSVTVPERSSLDPVPIPKLGPQLPFEPRTSGGKSGPEPVRTTDQSNSKLSQCLSRNLSATPVKIIVGYVVRKDTFDNMTAVQFITDKKSQSFCGKKDIVRKTQRVVNIIPITPRCIGTTSKPVPSGRSYEHC